MKEVKIKSVVKYNGHSVNGNGIVNVSFKAMYSELSESMKVCQLLNNDVIIKCKRVNDKPFKLGVFRVKAIDIHGDGESILRFTSLNDAVEMDNLNNIVSNDDFVILMESEIEEE